MGSAIKYTANTETVCGEEWQDTYIGKLTPDEERKLQMTEVHISKTFKFGDGKIVNSTKRINIPVKIGQNKCHIETEFVPSKIPLLLSKTSMKRAGIVIDMENYVQQTSKVQLYQL